MPWEETTHMEQRGRFVEEFDSTLYTVTELCERYGISRKTAYKWLNRWSQEGEKGLQDRSRAPKSSPGRTEDSVVERLLDLRRKHPTWGPRKLLVLLEKQYPAEAWPAASTAGAILKRHGLVQTRRRRDRAPIRRAALTQATAPNEVWTCDFKGQFRTRDGKLCYPLTVADSFSRYLLGVDGLDGVSTSQSWPVFERLFRDYGLPQVIRSDNGSPFASARALSGLCRLSVRWIKLGIVPSASSRATRNRTGAMSGCIGTWLRRPSVLRLPMPRLSRSASMTFDGYATSRGRTRRWGKRRQPNSTGRPCDPTRSRWPSLVTRVIMRCASCALEERSSSEAATCFSPRLFTGSESALRSSMTAAGRCTLPMSFSVALTSVSSRCMDRGQSRGGCPFGRPTGFLRDPRPSMSYWVTD